MQRFVTGDVSVFAKALDKTALDELLTKMIHSIVLRVFATMTKKYSTIVEVSGHLFLNIFLIRFAYRFLLFLGHDSWVISQA